MSKNNIFKAAFAKYYLAASLNPQSLWPSVHSANFTVPSCLQLSVGMVPIKAFNSFSFPAPDGFEVISVEQTPRSTIAPVRVVHPDPMFLVTLAPQRATKRGWHRLTIRFPPEGTVDVIAQLCFSDGEEFWRRLPARERNHFVLSIRCNSSPATIKLIVSGSGYLLRPSCIEFRPVSLLSGISGTLTRIPSVFRQYGLSAIGTIVRAGVRFTEPRSLVLVGGPVTTSQEVPYDRWHPRF